MDYMSERDEEEQYLDETYNLVNEPTYFLSQGAQSNY